MGALAAVLVTLDGFLHSRGVAVALLSVAAVVCLLYIAYDVGHERGRRATRAPSPPAALPASLKALRDDLRTAELLVARLPSASASVFALKRVAVPDDLLRDIDRWVRGVMDHLAQRPDYQRHFSGTTVTDDGPMGETRRAGDLRVRAGVLRQIYDQLSEDEQRR